MPLRDVIRIDRERCDGCGDCITACAEGAIALVDGKAELVSEVYCDGLGACLGHCPQGAITVERREAAEFDERAVGEHLARASAAGAGAVHATVVQHPGAPARPGHPHPVGEKTSTASFAPVLPRAILDSDSFAGCPGSRATVLGPAAPGDAPASRVAVESALRHWPVQLHLLSPTAPFLRDSDLLLAADCVAYAVGGFHERFLTGRTLTIACPKLDTRQELYVEKLRSMVDDGGVRSLEVMVMEVPCCSGLVRLAQTAADAAERKVPVTVTVVGIRGDLHGRQALL